MAGLVKVYSWVSCQYACILFFQTANGLHFLMVANELKIDVKDITVFILI